MKESMIDDLNDTARAFNNLNNTVVTVVPIDTGGNNLVVIVLFLDSLVLVCGDSSSPLLVRWSLPMRKVRVAHIFERLARLGWIQRMPSVQIWQLYKSTWISLAIYVKSPKTFLFLTDCEL